MDSVEMIASGYEWECPYCEVLNKEIETKTKVSCKECKSKYMISNIFDAIGK